jgi:hypothetical protein
MRLRSETLPPAGIGDHGDLGAAARFVADTQRATKRCVHLQNVEQ